MIRSITTSTRALKQLLGDSRLVTRPGNNVAALARLLSTKPTRSSRADAHEVDAKEEFMLQETNADDSVVQVEESITETTVTERTRPERHAPQITQLTEEALEGRITEGAKVAAGHARDMVSNFRPSLITTSEGQLVSRTAETFTVSKLRMEQIQDSLNNSKKDREERLEAYRASEAAEQSQAVFELNPNYPFSLDNLAEFSQNARVKAQVGGGTVNKKHE